MYRIKNWDGICQRLGSSGQKSFRKGPVWVCCFFILSFQSSLAWETHQKISSLNLVWEPRVSWAELCSLSGKGALVLSWRLPDLPPTLPGLCSPNADLERPFIMLSWSREPVVSPEMVVGSKYIHTDHHCPLAQHSGCY